VLRNALHTCSLLPVRCQVKQVAPCWHELRIAVRLKRHTPLCGSVEARDTLAKRQLHHRQLRKQTRVVSTRGVIAAAASARLEREATQKRSIA
jgi:hypothetical protein